jgi:hypothetical protein
VQQHHKLNRPWQQEPNKGALAAVGMYVEAAIAVIVRLFVFASAVLSSM